MGTLSDGRELRELIPVLGDGENKMTPPRGHQQLKFEGTKAVNLQAGNDLQPPESAPDPRKERGRGGKGRKRGEEGGR